MEQGAKGRKRKTDGILEFSCAVGACICWGVRDEIVNGRRVGG